MLKSMTGRAYADIRPRSDQTTEQAKEFAAIPQYRLNQISLIWGAGAVPMTILGWIVAPALAHDAQSPAAMRPAVLTVGLICQSESSCIPGKACFLPS